MNKILLLTHGKVGQAMLQAASNTLDISLENIKAISVSNNHSLEKLKKSQFILKKIIDTTKFKIQFVKY